MSAVPSDAPRFCAVPWRPPASFVCAGSTDDMITLPELRGEQPDTDAEQGEPEREPRRR